LHMPPGARPPARRRLGALCSQLRTLAAGARPVAGSDGDSGSAAAPFLPEAALAGGLVLALWPEDSPFLDCTRIHLPEEINPNAKPGAVPDGVVNQVRGVHNPSCEVHLRQATQVTNGAAVLLVPGGGHNQLGIANCTKLVPFFTQLGVTTIIVRPRLRYDGCATNLYLLGRVMTGQLMLIVRRVRFGLQTT
jgi:hypothetical protein